MGAPARGERAWGINESAAGAVPGGAFWIKWRSPGWGWLVEL